MELSRKGVLLQQYKILKFRVNNYVLIMLERLLADFNAVTSQNTFKGFWNALKEDMRQEVLKHLVLNHNLLYKLHHF